MSVLHIWSQGITFNRLMLPPRGWQRLGLLTTGSCHFTPGKAFVTLVGILQLSVWTFVFFWRIEQRHPVPGCVNEWAFEVSVVVLVRNALNCWNMGSPSRTQWLLRDVRETTREVVSQSTSPGVISNPVDLRVPARPWCIYTDACPRWTEAVDRQEELSVSTDGTNRESSSSFSFDTQKIFANGFSLFLVVHQKSCFGYRVDYVDYAGWLCCQHDRASQVWQSLVKTQTGGAIPLRGGRQLRRLIHLTDELKADLTQMSWLPATQGWNDSTSASVMWGGASHSETSKWMLWERTIVLEQ